MSHELTPYLSVFDLFLTNWIMAILSKGYKPDNFVSRSSQKLSFTNICGLPLNFAECESFLESNSPDILALCKTNLDDCWFWQFSFDSLSSFNAKGFYYSYAWSCSLCQERTSFCMGLISEKLWILTYVFDWLYLLHSSVFFLFYRSPSSYLCMVFDSVSSNIDEVFLTNPSVKLFLFGNFNIHHKDCLTYFGRTDRPGEICHLKWPFSDY